MRSFSEIFRDTAATLLLMLTAVFATSCGGSQVDGDSAVLRAVPSRAVAVAHFGRLDKALEMLTDSTSLFRQLDYGPYHDSEMSFSYVYSASLVPVLVIDAGHAGRDTSSQALKVLDNAQDCGLSAAYAQESTRKRALLIISTLQAAVNESLVHISENSSILDAPGFTQALSSAEGEAGILLLRGSAAHRWMPKGLLADIFPRSSLVRFAESYSEWISAGFDEYSLSRASLGFLQDPAFGHFCAVPQAVEGGKSKLHTVLPEDYLFALDLPLQDPDAYQKAYHHYLDVKAGLSVNKIRCRQMESRCGVSPIAWAKGIGLKEIALIAFPGGKVLALRGARKQARQGEIQQNSCPGASALLFGAAFALEDESGILSSGHWLFIGSEDALEAFSATAKGVRAESFPDKECKFAVCTPGWQIAADGDKIGLNIWN
ncbi:MAG: hypothetical protein IJ686_02740 [Bacteroidales bacterium]|nr:hypothetical protein [Bacteroidales bacterium]